MPASPGPVTTCRPPGRPLPPCRVPRPRATPRARAWAHPLDSAGCDHCRALRPPLIRGRARRCARTASLREWDPGVGEYLVQQFLRILTDRRRLVAGRLAVHVNPVAVALEADHEINGSTALDHTQHVPGKEAEVPIRVGAVVEVLLDGGDDTTSEFRVGDGDPTQHWE